jgi:hypothetical protein
MQHKSSTMEIVIGPDAMKFRALAAPVAPVGKD